ncbi:MAG: phosphatase PAP2 family protein [Rubrimonas sp.]
MIPDLHDRRALNAAALLTAILVAFTFLDAPMLAWAAAADPAFRDFWRAVTKVGESGWMLAASAALGLAAWWVARRARGGRLRTGALAVQGVAAYLFASVAIFGLLAALLKLLIGRARPKMAEPLGAYHFDPFAFDFKFNSFPSGHAATLFALAAGLALIAPRWRALILTAAAWGAFSRAPAGAHYLSDIIAGSALGYFGARWLARRLAARGLVFSRDLRLLAPMQAAAAVRLTAVRARSAAVGG